MQKSNESRYPYPMRACVRFGALAAVFVERPGRKRLGGLALVSTIINLAHSMKLNVVAEGVETDEQARLLRLLNCDEIQGYWFGHPVPRDVFEAKYLGAPA